MKSLITSLSQGPKHVTYFRFTLFGNRHKNMTGNSPQIPCLGITGDMYKNVYWLFILVLLWFLFVRNSIANLLLLCIHIDPIHRFMVLWLSNYPNVLHTVTHSRACVQCRSRARYWYAPTQSRVGSHVTARVISYSL